jgi:tRNA G18 (ribose-2'-O)-methylase SpoU
MTQISFHSLPFIYFQGHCFRFAMAVSSQQSQSFVLGVATALSVVLVTHLFQEVRQQRLATKKAATSNRVVPHELDDADETQQSKSSTSTAQQQDQLLDTPDLDLRLIRKAEAVIQWRSSSVTLVVERCTNDHNYSAILRTAEALGIQNVWIIDPPAWTDGGGNNEDSEEIDTVADTVNRTGLKLSPDEIEQRSKHRLFAQNATEWLTLREFGTTAECVQVLKESNHQIWVTDLSQEAVSLTPDSLQEAGNWPLPQKVAIVFGTEAVGCSQEMLDAGDLRVYLPLRGFADSLNLSVATALIIHQLFVLEPNLVGNMSESERKDLRTAWFSKLARQRLLSAREKKMRRKLLTQIDNCKRLQARVDAGHTLTKEQVVKAQRAAEYQATLSELEQGANYSDELSKRAVASLVETPPLPMTDLRRADLHRVTFVGKNTKKLHADHWRDMAATNKAHSIEKSTASYFRERVASVTKEGSK